MISALSSFKIFFLNQNFKKNLIKNYNVDDANL